LSAPPDTHLGVKFDHPVDDALGTQSRVRVLRVLTRAKPEENVTGREVARRARISHPQVSRTLRELAEVGLVTGRKFGTYALYEFNRHHVLARPMQALFEVEEALGDDLLTFLATRVATCRHVRAAILVDDPSAEMELVVLTAPDRDLDVDVALGPVRHDVRVRFGSRLETTVIPRRRAIELARNGDARWRRIAEAGIPVYRVFPRVR
jgi:Fe2+ or Zn2+ uptake regulation protein